MKTIATILTIITALSVSQSALMAAPVLHDGDASTCTYYAHVDLHANGDHSGSWIIWDTTPEYWISSNITGEYVVPDVPAVQQYVDTTLSHPNCVREVNTWSVSFSPPTKDTRVSVSASMDLPPYVYIVDTLYSQICSAVSASFTSEPTITISGSCSTKSISNTTSGVLTDDSVDIMMAGCTKWKARAYYYKYESPVVATSFKECQWNCQHYRVAFPIGPVVLAESYNSQGEGVSCTVSGTGNRYSGLYVEPIYDGECPLTGVCAQSGS